MNTKTGEKIMLQGVVVDGFLKNPHVTGSIVTEVRPATKPAFVLGTPTSWCEAISEEEEEDEESKAPADPDNVVDAGVSETMPVLCGDLRKDHLVVMPPNHPCCITSISFSKGGVSGAATKATITAKDLFTGAILTQAGVPTSTWMAAPIITHKMYTAIDLQGPLLTLMDDEHTIRQDLTLPENSLGYRLRFIMAEKEMRYYYPEIRVTVLSYMGQDQVVGAQRGVCVL